MALNVKNTVYRWMFCLGCVVYLLLFCIPLFWVVLGIDLLGVCILVCLLLCLLCPGLGGKC